MLCTSINNKVHKCYYAYQVRQKIAYYEIRLTIKSLIQKRSYQITSTVIWLLKRCWCLLFILLSLEEKDKMNFSVDNDTCRRLIVSSSLNGYEHQPGQQKMRSSSTVMGYIFLRSVHTTPIILLYSYLHIHVGEREEKREKRKKM
jgi:hypothetical protein